MAIISRNDCREISLFFAPSLIHFGHSSSWTRTRLLLIEFRVQLYIGAHKFVIKKLQKARPSVSNFYLTVILSITNYIITLFFFEFSSFEPAIIKPCWKSLLLVAAWTPSSNYYKITTVFLSGIFVLLRSLRRRNGNHFRLDSLDQCPLLEIPIKGFNQSSYKSKMWFLLRLLVYLKLQIN